MLQKYKILKKCFLVTDSSCIDRGQINDSKGLNKMFIDCTRSVIWIYNNVKQSIIQYCSVGFMPCILIATRHYMLMSRLPCLWVNQRIATFFLLYRGESVSFGFHLFSITSSYLRYSFTLDSTRLRNTAKEIVKLDGYIDGWNICSG